MGSQPITIFTTVNESGLNSGGSQAKQNTEFGIIDNIPAGWEVIGPGGQTVDYGRLVMHGDAWKFELTSSVQHNGGSDDDFFFSPSEKPTLLVRDTDGVEYEIPIDVNILDDMASIRGSAALKVNGGNEVNSRLTIAYGADGANAESPIAVKGAEAPQISGDVALYTLEHGTLELNTKTGAYSFKAGGITENVANVQQTVTFVAKDGDGDAVERTVQITINKPPLPEIALASFVEEAGMDNGGSRAQTDSEFGEFMGLPQGWIVVGAGGTTASYGEVVQENGTWCFKLTGAVSHTEEGEGDTSLRTDKPTVLIQDALGNTYEIPVSVTIADDAPFLGGDKTVTVKGGSTLEGDLSIIYGADGPGAGGKISLAGVTPDTVEDGIATYTTPMGILTLNTVTGHYLFKAAPLAEGTQKAVEQLSFIVTDADGDTATLDVDVAVTSAIPPSWLRLTSLVSEAGLENGQWAGSGMDAGKLVGLPADWSVVSTGPGVDYGHLVQKNGAWYFELTKALDHSGGNSSGTLRPLDKPSIIVEDSAGVRYEIPVSVSILDDAPEIFSLADEYVERYQTDLSPVTVSGFLEMSYGADGSADTRSIMWDTDQLGHLTSKGQPVEFSQSEGLLTASVHGKTVFTLSLRDDGEYEYTQYRHIDSTSELAFSLTLRDADGDETTVEDVLIVHIDTDVSDIPDILSPDEDDRFVLYSDGTAQSINGKGVAGNVLANDNDPEAMMISVSNGTYGKAAIDVNGAVRYTLHADAASRMPGGTDPVYDQLTYTAVDGNGNRYERTIEIIVNRVNVCDDIYASDNRVNGEAHESHISIEGDYLKKTPEIMGSDGNDKFMVNGSISYATVNMGQGDNSVVITPGNSAEFAVKRATLVTEDGNDEMRIGGYTDASTISMGHGNNVFIAASAANSTTTLNDTTLTMGDGADRVRITNTVADNVLSAVNTVNVWSTKLFALPTADTGGTLDNGTAIDLGAGNNRIEVVVNPEKTNTGTFTGGYTLYNVYTDPYTALNNGSTITSKSRAGELSTVLIDSSAHGLANNSHIYVQGGNADIAVNTSRTMIADNTAILQGGNLTVGMYNGSSVQTADGQDTISFTSTGYAMYKDSHIITGDGEKLISLHSRSTQTLMRDGCSVQTGSGNDTISLSTSTVGGEALYDYGAAKYDETAHGVLMDNSFIDAGAGRNDISVTSSMNVNVSYAQGWYGVWGLYQPGTLNLSAYGINDNSGIKAGLGTTDAQKVTVSSTTNAMGNNAYILSGNGNDTIAVTAGTTAGGHEKYALYNNSLINAGNGNNAVTVFSEDYALSGTVARNALGSHATGDYYAGGSKIMTGNGDDTIAVTVTGRLGNAMQYSSGIHAGEGNNAITVTNTNQASYSGIVHNSGITAGNGNNSINVSSYANALQDYSYVRVGDGDNSINLKGAKYHAQMPLWRTKALFTRGTAVTPFQSPGRGNGIRNSSILAGDGGNTVTVTATQGTALYNSAKIVTGAGDDVVIASGLAGVTSKSEISTGKGNDTVSLTGTTQYALHDARLDTGAGSDSITLKGTLAAAYGSMIDTGTGDDTITVLSTNASGLHLTSLHAGEGNDLLNITAACAAGNANGLLASHVVMGEGNDTVHIAVTGKTAVGMSGNTETTTLTLGSGNDVLEIHALGSTYGSAVTAYDAGTVLDAGDGNDAILLSGSRYALDVAGTGINQILCGNGDDTITFDGFVNGPALQNIIDGGSGQDELRILLDGVGVNDMALLNGVVSNSTITNVENVVLDLFGRTEDTLVLTQEHLDNLYKSGWAHPNTEGTGSSADVYVNGTDYDTLNLSETGSWHQAGTTQYSGETYNHWVSSTQQDIFIMQDILLITS